MFLDKSARTACTWIQASSLKKKDRIALGTILATQQANVDQPQRAGESAFADAVTLHTAPVASGTVARTERRPFRERNRTLAIISPAGPAKSSRR